jgi:prolyl oligopeptidase
MTDPYLWLEDVDGDEAMKWVVSQNTQTDEALTTTSRFAAMRADVHAALDSADRLPHVVQRGGHLYNFWTDETHERGVWRRTTLEQFRRPEPEWEIVLDIDALNAAEGESWVWHGAESLPPAHQRCLVRLSRGGADADVTREFDLVTKQWVTDGFVRAEAKGELIWIDDDTVFVSTDFGPGSMNESGYPRLIKRWRRSTPLEAADTVYEGLATDAFNMTTHVHTPGHRRSFITRVPVWYTSELLHLGDDDALEKLEAPDSAEKSVHGAWLAMLLREPWELGEASYPQGSLLVADVAAWLRGDRTVEVLFTPTDRQFLQDYAWTSGRVVINVLDDVHSRLLVCTPGADGWAETAFDGAPDGALEVSAVDEDDSDAVWIRAEGFLTPPTLWLAADDEPPERLKSMPALFDSSALVTEQHFATSADGTRIPYFVVSRADLAVDGRNPTLLWGYGGFEIPITPAYSAAIGACWLARGGVYVAANLRGGGEYGPRWHQAALRDQRNRCYEDCAAVAHDLIERGITSPAHLGVSGRSNGGLMVGNMLTQYPDLFGAVLCGVPLLDMERYHLLLAGASWIGEYGNPAEPDDWAFIQTFSPYHLVRGDRHYPPVYFFTSTRDDRVHPGHARKMAAKMIEFGHDVTYFENVEGGHAGSADSSQEAKWTALQFEFLWQRLGQTDGAPAG